MNLKRVLIDLLTAEQLKDLCNELELEADRRSPAAMAEALASAKRAKPERLIAPLTVAQLREGLAQFDRPSDGRRDELVQRLLQAGGRVWPLPDATLELEVQVQPVPSARQPEATAATRVVRTGLGTTEQYRHSTEAVQRPDVGVQDQFQAKKPPRTYRYDSSLDPALSWDEQRERDLGEWLLGLVVRAAKEGEKTVFAEPQVWAGGGVRIASLADAAQMLQQISKPFLNWAGKAERHQIQVPTAPLFVHERHSTKAILDGIRHRKARGQTLDLFGDAGMDVRENLEAYEHKGPWQNRMILGDSLSVMNSLLEFEGLAGQVQMIYIDPPYGVKFGSNFQPFVRNNKVAPTNRDEDLTREPEMVKAYRDTWEIGLHSFLTYLRDRLLLAKELLHRSGSVFVQISDDNTHLVRSLLDEIFGPQNFLCEIVVEKTSSSTADGLATICDYVLWYSKDKSATKFRPIYRQKVLGAAGTTQYVWLDHPSGKSDRKLSAEELSGQQAIPDGWRVFACDNLTSQSPPCYFPVSLGGREFLPGKGYWKTNESGMSKLRDAHRLKVIGNSLMYKRYLDDFVVSPIANVWSDTKMTGFSEEKLYVVQTPRKVVERCILMTTDPGDLGMVCINPGQLCLPHCVDAATI